MIRVGTMIPLTLLIPLLGAGVISLLGRWPDLRETASLVTAASLVGVVLSLLLVAAPAGSTHFTLLEVLPGLRLALHLEPLGLAFASVASTLWVLTSLYSIGYMRGHGEEHQTRFYACFALTIAAAMGIAFAGNVFTLFVFYEIMTLVTYPLVTHRGDREAVGAGRLYLGYLFGTSVGFFLFAMVWTWLVAGTLDFEPGGILAGKASPGIVGCLLFLYAFGIGKAALMPFHRWLPAAMVAPTPVSALLHAVAVVKAGVFSVLKIVVYIFGIDLLRDTGWNVWLAYLAAVTIVVASLIAFTKDNLKARLAYSTISQLAYIVLGAGLSNAGGVVGAAMHIVTHAFGKITLFFCAGAIAVAAHKTNISEMDRIGRTMPVTMGAFLIGSLSIIGLPPLGGVWSKWYLIAGAAGAGEFPLVAVLLLSSLLNIGYLLPVAVRAFFGVPSQSPRQVKIKEAPLCCLIPICITSAGCLALFFFANQLYAYLINMLG